MEIINLIPIKTKSITGIICECSITKDLKELTGLSGEFYICYNYTEAIGRLEYNGISIGDIIVEKIDSIKRKIVKTSLYLGNYSLIPEFNTSIVNTIYRYLKDLENNVCIVY